MNSVHIIILYELTATPLSIIYSVTRTGLYWRAAAILNDHSGNTIVHQRRQCIPGPVDQDPVMYASIPHDNLHPHSAPLKHTATVVHRVLVAES